MAEEPLVTGPHQEDNFHQGQRHSVPSAFLRAHLQLEITSAALDLRKPGDRRSVLRAARG